MDRDAHGLCGVPELAAADRSDEEVTRRAAARAYRPARIDIDDALRHDWLEFWYQPKLDLTARQFVGAEALARIRHPELGVLLPRSFLSDISANDMVRVTERALLDALRTWPLFDDAGFNLRLSINAPMTALRALPLAQLVEDSRPSAPHWPGLILELTEEDVARDPLSAEEMATQLTDARLSLAVDDFGGRQTAFAGMRERAFAEFKLDIGYVRNCSTDPAQAAICHSAVDVAHRLEADIVAEGIETGPDMQALTAMGCDCGQGVLIAPPLPRDKFLDLLRQRTQPAPERAPARPAARTGGIGLDTRV